MKTLTPAILFALSLLVSPTAHSQTLKTATVDRLLQREYVGSVLVDDDRGRAYFERVDAIDSSPARFPYPTAQMYKNARKKVYSAPLDGSAQATPLFRQDADTGYYFASDNPWSPNRRYMVIYKFRQGEVQPGVVDVRKRTATFFEIGADYPTEESSVEWVSSYEFVIASAEGIANQHIYLVNGVLAIDEVRKKGWRDGAVTAGVVGAGKYASTEDSRPGVELIKIDVRTGSVEPVERGKAGIDDRGATQLSVQLSGALDLDSFDPVAISEAGVFYIQNGDLWCAGPDGGSEKLTGEYPHELKIHKVSDPWRDFPLGIIRSADNEMTPPLDRVLFSAEIAGKTEYLLFSADGQSYGVVSSPSENSRLLAASGEGAVFLTNSYEQGSLLHYVKAGDSEQPVTIYRFNRQLVGVTPAVGPIPVRHHGFDGREVTSWLFLPPGASLKHPTPYPTVMIPYAELVYGDEELKGIYALDTWQLDLTMGTAAEVFAAKGYAVLLPSISLVDRGETGKPMAHMMPAILSGLDGAIETGFVDPDRLAVSGHSFGGYTALSIAVQSDRFKAVIAQAPAANFISIYGQFSPYLEVQAQQSSNQGPGAAIAIGQGRMAGPPWRDVDRYVRNSPLFLAHQAAAPIMLIHGDYDGVAVVEQSEEMFTALKQEGKDVIFVRYFGEHHKTVQPQNQRDMWARIFDFLEDNDVAPCPNTVH